MMTVDSITGGTLVPPPGAAADTVRKFFRKTFATTPPEELPWRQRKVDIFFADAFQKTSVEPAMPCGVGDMRMSAVFDEFVWD